MRGTDTRQQMLFSYVSPEARVPQDHPLRPIRKMADKALKELSPVFRELYTFFHTIKTPLIHHCRFQNVAGAEQALYYKSATEAFDEWL